MTEIRSLKLWARSGEIATAITAIHSQATAQFWTKALGRTDTLDSITSIPRAVDLSGRRASIRVAPGSPVVLRRRRYPPAIPVAEIPGSREEVGLRGVPHLASRLQLLRGVRHGLPVTLSSLPAISGVVSTLLMALLLATTAPARGEPVDELSERYRRWLREVDLLIVEEERRAFLALEKDYQRDAFIERFWEARDPYPATERNELRDTWYARLEEAEEEFGNWTEDRARVLLLNGAPSLREEISTCQLVLHPAEVWHYFRSERARRSVKLLFYQRGGSPPPVLWRPQDGYLALFSETKRILEQRCLQEGVGKGPSRIFPHRFGENPHDISFECTMVLFEQLCGRERGALLRDVVWDLEMEDKVAGSVENMLARLQSRPDPEEEEWLGTFSAHSTDLPADAELLEAEAEVRFPARHQARIVVETLVRVPREQATAADLGPHSSYDFVLTGEILREEELFESFRYTFGFPRAEAPEILPLVFRRHLRPGEYEMVLKLEEVHGQRFLRREIPITVPREPEIAQGPEPAWATEARESLAEEQESEAVVELRAEASGVLVGSVRFEAAVRGEGVDRMTFSLDGEPVLSRTRPPFTVELQLGDSPRPHTVRATAYDAAGKELGTDALEINAGENRFAVNIMEPRSGRTLDGLVTVRVEVVAPDESTLDRLELYRGEDLVATLHQPPYEQPVPAPEGPGFLRAVAYLQDGNSTEDLVLVNVEGSLEEVDVELVELYATVLDPRGRPVTGVRADELTVREEGSEQEMVRFEPVSDRPVHLAVVVDASASMEEHLPAVRKAAAGFLESFLEPRDRAALIVFNDKPRLLEKLTGDVGALTEELAGFAAEGNTALYDSLVFALHHLAGIRGQKALLVLTDGKDQTSRFDFDQTLAYTRAAGAAIYAIGIGTDMLTRRHLDRLADESGAGSFRLQGPEALPEIYASIARELRAGYLLVYQSSRSDGDRAFRRVEVTVDRPGHEARTIRGYYP